MVRWKSASSGDRNTEGLQKKRRREIEQDDHEDALEPATMDTTAQP